MANAQVQTQQTQATVRWTSGSNAVVGAWLFFAPFLLGYSGLAAALWNDLIIGAAVFFLSLGRTAYPMRNEGISWTNLVLGGWLIIAPFVLAYGEAGAGANAGAAIWNDVIVGIIVAVLATTSALASRGKSAAADRR